MNDEMKFQPTEEQQKELNDLQNKNPEYVQIVGENKKYKIGWLHNGTLEKITDITFSVDKDNTAVNDRKISSKVAAAIILNGHFSIKFLYWFLWRWFYYVKQYTDEQLMPIIETGKKKVPLEAYYRITISVIGMRDTIMTMTKKDVEHFRQELVSEQATQ